MRKKLILVLIALLMLALPAFALSNMPWPNIMWQKDGLAGYYKSTATVAVMNL